MEEERAETTGAGRGEGSLVVVGKVLREWGVRGEFLVAPMTFDPERFLSLAEVYLGEAPAVPRRLTGVRFHKDLIRMGIEGCRTPEEARLLRGSFIRIERSESPELPEGTYYHYQIIGLMVYDTDGRSLGRVESIIETRGNDVYVVNGEDGEVLIPAIRDVIREIDPDAGRMTVELLDLAEE